MTKYHLHTLALRLRPGKLDYTFHNVRVPDPWRSETLEIQSQRTRRDQAKTTVPTDNLNRALCTLFPSLLAVSKDAWRKGQTYWLLADQPLPLPALSLFVREWANASFSELSSARRSALIDTFRNTPLTTIPETINLAAWTTRRGTAHYDGQADIYNLLPNFIAAKFCRDGVALPGWGDFNKPFYRVPLTSADAKGAEIMSWPPERFDGGRAKNGKGADYFSVFITFTVQTVPFDPHPVIHCDVGLRRWASRPLWGFRDACSVYLLSKKSWFDADLSNSFTVAPMHRYATGSNPDGSAIFESGWGKKDALTKILRRADLSQPFPSASEIFDDPLKWLINGDGVQAAMTWGTDSGYKDGSKHSVGTGLPHLDRQKLWEWVCGIVAPELEAAEPIPVISLPTWTPTLTNPFFPKIKQSEQVLPAEEDDLFEEDNATDTEDEEAPEPVLSVTKSIQDERSNLLKNAVGSGVEIGLHYDSEAIRASVEATLFDLFGVPPQSPHFQLPNGVTIHWNPVKKNGSLYGPLFLGNNPEVRLRNSEMLAAIEQRRDALKAALPPATVRAVSLVELEDYRFLKNMPRVSDPKTALRKGFAQSRRLTQFLAPPLKAFPADWQNTSAERNKNEKTALSDLRLRTTNAVLDALRQLGVQIPLRGGTKKSPLNHESTLTPLHFVGFWLAKHTRSGSRTGIGGNLPLLVKIDAETGEITAQALSVKNEQGSQGWMPYPELLLQLGCDNYDILNAREHGPRFIQYTQERVSDLVGKNYVLFAHAQNSRSDGWHYIGNKNIEVNRLGFERYKTSAPMTYSSGLRVVRIRDEDLHETPQSFVCRVEDTGEVLVPAAGKGIYSLNESAFFVRTGRPVTMQKVNATMSKLNRRTSTRGGEIAPQAGETTPHVRLLEVVPFGLQPGDDPFAFAALTLKLCEAATHFGGSTALPLPLHLAEKIEEYLHPLPTDTKDEEDLDDMT